MAQLDPQKLYEKIEKSLSEQSFSPIYFFYGDEPYLIHQAVQYLKTCALHGTVLDFNYSSYYASDANVVNVRDEIETLPMMSSRRVVILREVQDLSDKEWDDLEPVLANPVQTTVLILVGSKLDKRKKFFKLLLEQSEMVEFKKPYENQIPGWIRHICRAHGLDIDEEAIQLLHRLAGSQLTEIEAEVKKLADYVGERKTIRLEDVAQCVSRRREENVFELTEKIASGDRVSALLRLAHLLEQGQSEVGITSLVARHMRILLQIKQGQAAGLTGQKLSAFAQVPNYYLQDYLQQARIWTEKQLESSLLLLAETDKALKSSPLSSHIWLENLILKTCELQHTS